MAMLNNQMVYPHFSDHRIFCAEWQERRPRNPGPAPSPAICVTHERTRCIPPGSPTGAWVTWNWSSWHLTDLSLEIVGKATLLTPHSTVYSLHFILPTLHFTLYTVHFTLPTLHFTNYTFHTLHSTLYTPHSTLRTLDYALYTPLCTLHSRLYTTHFTLSSLHTLHSRFHTSHVDTQCSTPCATLSSPDSTLLSLDTTLPTRHSTVCSLLYTLHNVQDCCARM